MFPSFFVVNFEVERARYGGGGVCVCVCVCVCGGGVRLPLYL